MSEEVEAIMRLIADLRDKVKFAKDRIAYLREEEKALRTEYEKAPLKEKWRIRRELTVTWGAIGGLTRWMRYYEARIRELEKVIPPHKFLRHKITFSIVTGTGHEPFYAEVTCDTVIAKEVGLDEIKFRLINSVIKLFWIMFDVQKALYDMELAGLKGTPDYKEVVKRKTFIQYYATMSGTEEELEKYRFEVRETYMDVLLRIVPIEREPEEYVTREAIIKIGVEPPLPMPDEAKPKYPLVYLLVEKGKTKATKSEFVKRAKLLIAKTTDVDILKKLGIELE